MRIGKEKVKLSEKDAVEETQNVTESQQFKRWFGDWQNNPAKASKVVNKDGTPKVLYHGTPGKGFTATDNVGTFDGTNPDIRFSMKDSVEATDKLIAVHNLSAEQLQGDIDLGGFPMPSIAVTKPEMGHTNFGDISIIFGRDTIDPARRSNKVYGGDAYTPTFPQVGYKPNRKVADRLSDLYYKVYRAAGHDIAYPLYKHSKPHKNREGKLASPAYYSLISGFTFTEKLAVQTSEQLSCLPCYEADKEGGYYRALAYTVKLMRKYQRKRGGGERKRRVKAYFGYAELRMPRIHHGPYKGFARQHGNVCQNLKVNAKAEHSAAEHEHEYLYNIILRCHKAEKYHGKVYKIAE